MMRGIVSNVPSVTGTVEAHFTKNILKASVSDAFFFAKDLLFVQKTCKMNIYDLKRGEHSAFGEKSAR